LKFSYRVQRLLSAFCERRQDKTFINISVQQPVILGSFLPVKMSILRHIITT